MSVGLEPETLVQALSEPAALVSADGRILRSNDGWIRSVGGVGRLPRSVESGGLFDAMKAARRGEAAGTPGRRRIRDGRIAAKAKSPYAVASTLSE